MHQMIRKVFLIASITAVSAMNLFPAFAEGAAGQAVTAVEAVSEEQPKDEHSKVSFSDQSNPAPVSPSDSGYVDAGPGIEKKEPELEKPKEISLGIFKITGYCNCEQCSGGHNLTYSGTVPAPNHTVSADLSRYPLGTKLKVNGTVYTVEDKGSSVNGNILDIFYSTHEEAVAKGTYNAEVFLVQE